MSLVGGVQSHVDVLASGGGRVFLGSSRGPSSRESVNHSVDVRPAELTVVSQIQDRTERTEELTHGIEYLSLVYWLSSPSFLGGARTRCSVDLSSSFDHRIMKSPMLNTIAPGTGGAGRKRSFSCCPKSAPIAAFLYPKGDATRTGSSTSSPPTSSWKRKVHVEKSWLISFSSPVILSGGIAYSVSPYSSLLSRLESLPRRRRIYPMSKD